MNHLGAPMSHSAVADSHSKERECFHAQQQPVDEGEERDQTQEEGHPAQPKNTSPQYFYFNYQQNVP
jgi:hypothetical protein